MSSTAVTTLNQNLADLHRQLTELREQVEAALVETEVPVEAGVYRAISRDLFDLSSKLVGYGWEADNGEARLPFGFMRVNDLKTADQITLMEFLARQVRLLIEHHGAPVPTQWVAQAVARKLHTTPDEVYYGVTYGEEEGLFTSQRGGFLALPD